MALYRKASATLRATEQLLDPDHGPTFLKGGSVAWGAAKDRWCPRTPEKCPGHPLSLHRRSAKMSKLTLAKRKTRHPARPPVHPDPYLPLGTRFAHMSDMTPIQFGLKRAHHRSLQLSHKFLRPFGITPARFDMLQCVDRLGDGFQRDLVDALGVSAPTVSRMLKALVELGLIAKGRFEEWGRVNRVTLTMEGRALLKQIVDSLYGSGIVDVAEQAVSSWSHVSRRVALHRERLYNHLRWVRFMLGDTAIRFKNWDGDDDSPFNEKELRKPLALFADANRRDIEFFGLPPLPAPSAQRETR